MGRSVCSCVDVRCGGVGTRRDVSACVRAHVILEVWAHLSVPVAMPELPLTIDAMLGPTLGSDMWGFLELYLWEAGRRVSVRAACS